MKYWLLLAFPSLPKLLQKEKVTVVSKTEKCYERSSALVEVMGKKQHQKDKLYITNKEWREEWGGKRAESLENSRFKRLPFNCCSLTFQPFEHPLCTKEGVVFDLMSIVPYLKKYGTNPVTGEALNAKDLVKLNFHKNSNGKMHCPITFKIFTENTHIVAIKQTGNVYSYEAVEKLNIKPKNFKDLLTDEEFTRKDIITIQDPTSLDKFDISKFHHVKRNVKLVNEKDEQAKSNPMYTIRRANAETASTLSELAKSYKEPTSSATKEDQESTLSDTAAHYSTGVMAGSFTSTSFVPQTKQQAAMIDKDVVRYSKIKTKAYLQMQTSCGYLNFELHSDQVPKTCENFIGLCKKGYYNNTTFHRMIKNFMIQGGDPTASGHGGESFWGKPFEDEFKMNLSHQGRGILSMANSGKDTNKSQFFITFRSCRHLDNKHTVFGKVVGGIDTLKSMEEIETDAEDRPRTKISITKILIFVDPFEELDKEIESEKQAAKSLKEENETRGRVRPHESATNVVKLKAHHSGVGKYIGKKNEKSKASHAKGNDDNDYDDDDDDEVTPKKVKKATSSSGFGNFSSW